MIQYFKSSRHFQPILVSLKFVPYKSTATASEQLAKSEDMAERFLLFKGKKYTKLTIR